MTTIEVTNLDKQHAGIPYSSKSTVERPYLYIKPPEIEEAGRYLLIAARPAFGTALGTPVMIKLDTLKHYGMGESAWIEGYRETEKVIEFPAMCPYLLIPTDRIQLLSAEEAAARDKELAKKLDSVLKDSEKDEGGTESGEVRVVRTGVYL